jgi:hypothetical protein
VIPAGYSSGVLQRHIDFELAIGQMKKSLAVWGERVSMNSFTLQPTCSGDKQIAIGHYYCTPRVGRQVIDVILGIEDASSVPSCSFDADLCDTHRVPG